MDVERGLSSGIVWSMNVEELMNTGRTPLLDLSIANIYAEYQERQCILYHIGISASTNPVSG